MRLFRENLLDTFFPPDCEEMHMRWTAQDAGLCGGDPHTKTAWPCMHAKVVLSPPRKCGAPWGGLPLVMQEKDEIHPLCYLVVCFEYSTADLGEVQ
mmetsp:Transcript_10504/g.24370  ORF Transcript_10504/g.24370 Transcript_10504/m.24370 type:complete len:96 (+) Transcript_10504:280-567(+)